MPLDLPIHQANKSSPYGNLTREEFYVKHQVLHEESLMLNGHGMKIFTQSWRPAPRSSADHPAAGLKGLVAMVHGYASESGWVFELTAVALAKLGFHAFALDLRGHGRSDGDRAHLPDVRLAVDDCIEFFDSVRLARRLPAFLYGESLGGAIALFIALKQKDEWDGLIMNGSMCGVAKKFKPVYPLEKLLPAAARLAPRWRVFVTKSLVEKSYREKWKRELVRGNPRGQAAEHPTAATALQLLRVCEEIGRRSREVELPLLVVHGGDDAVCDAQSARRVFEMAGSPDKTLKVLPDAWHQLIGETEENVDEGFGFIFAWLVKQAGRVRDMHVVN